MAATKTIKKIICDKCKYDFSAQNIKKHNLVCNGTGSRKHKKGKHVGQDWIKGKTYNEVYGLERSEKIKQKKSNSLINSDKFSNLGRAALEDKEIERKLKISNSMINNTNWKNSIHKSGRGKRGYYKGFYFMSSWELAYIAYCLDHGLNIKRNLESFDYTFENKPRKYFPDFIVNDEFVEVKGYTSKQFEAKKQQFPYNLNIIDSEKIKPILKYVIDKWGINFVDIMKDVEK